MWQVPYNIDLNIHQQNLHDPLILGVTGVRFCFYLVLSHEWHWENNFALFGQMSLLFPRQVGIQILK